MEGQSQERMSMLEKRWWRLRAWARARMRAQRKDAWLVAMARRMPRPPSWAGRARRVLARSRSSGEDWGGGLVAESGGVEDEHVVRGGGGEEDGGRVHGLEGGGGGAGAAGDEAFVDLERVFKFACVMKVAEVVEGDE